MHTVRYSRLSNGVRVVTVQRRGLHTSSIRATYECGSRHDQRGHEGQAHFLEHMLFRGSRLHPDPQELNRALDAISPMIDAVTGHEQTTIEQELPAEKLEESCRVIGDMLAHPQLSNIELEREVLLREASEVLLPSGNTTNAHDIAHTQVFHGHPLSRPTIGTFAGIRAESARSLREHAQVHLAGARMTVATASPLDHDDQLQAVSRGFDRVVRGRSRIAQRPFVVTQKQPSAFFSYRKQESGAVIIVAFPWLNAGHSRAHSAAFMLQRLLDGSSTSRLISRLRNELGMVYGLTTDSICFRDTGILAIDTETAIDKTERLLTELLMVLAIVARDGPTGEELANLRERHRYMLACTDDSTAALASYYLDEARIGTRKTLPDTDREIRQVTCEEIRHAAQSILRPTHLNITIRGPYCRPDLQWLRKIISGYWAVCDVFCREW